MPPSSCDDSDKSAPATVSGQSSLIRQTFLLWWGWPFSQLRRRWKRSSFMALCSSIISSKTNKGHYGEWSPVMVQPGPLSMHYWEPAACLTPQEMTGTDQTAAVTSVLSSEKRLKGRHKKYHKVLSKCPYFYADECGKETHLWYSLYCSKSVREDKPSFLA